MNTLTRTLLCGAALFGIGIAAAQAADLSVRARPAPAQVYTAAPAFTWTGFYVGANVGYGWGKLTGTEGVAGNGFVGAGSASSGLNVNGVIGGGQLGYNWQTGAFVLGVEADIQGAGEHRTDSIGCGVACTLSAETRIDSFATLRGRVGVTPWDRGLLYFTGGAAWMHASDTLNLTTAGGTARVLDQGISKMGWTIGGGLEQMVWDRWSVKVEYLYMRAEDVTSSTNIPAALGGGTLTTTGTISNNVLRAGLNYHF
jgi:outer membrane immunogenic protein